MSRVFARKPWGHAAHACFALQTETSVRKAFATRCARISSEAMPVPATVATDAMESVKVGVVICYLDKCVFNQPISHSINDQS